MWGAVSDERAVCPLPETQSAVISLLSVSTIYILHVIICMYIQYMQGQPCQIHSSNLITSDQADSAGDEKKICNKNCNTAHTYR
jgi:hypothetical protein